MAGCRICAGELELKVAGNGAPVTAAALSPSAHAVGGHGDLLRLPRVRHRAAADPAQGRRAARPLPRDARRRVPGRGGRPARDREPAAGPDRRARPGGPAARRRLRPRAAARRGAHSAATTRSGWSSRARPPRHARETLGLDVREVPLEGFSEGRNGDSPGEFDVIVLADVIEHLDDPVDAIDRCAHLLKPGGALCVVTPDPSSVTARLAGSRWWGYLPAHTVLLPRKTLRELISAAGLVISDDIPFVRTFAAKRWVGGLAERLGPVSRAADAGGGPAAADQPQPLARRRARDPRPPHAGPAPRAPAAQRRQARSTSSCPPTRRCARSRTWPRRCRSTPPTARC